MPDRIDNKRKVLEVETRRYFGETFPTLAAHWEAAIAGLAPAIFRELSARLRNWK
jgi:hypothetical protein